MATRSPPPSSPSQSQRSQPPPTPPVSEPPPPPSTLTPPQQLNNIIDALIGAGDFGNWVNIISGTNPLVLPLSATLFIPQDDAIDHLINADPFMFPYHVIPQRLSFSDLQLFKSNTRLPTLLPGKSILITNNSKTNFTVDDSRVFQPDLYITATVAVHGVEEVLDYAVYGDGLDLLPKLNFSQQPQLVRPPPGPLMPEDEEPSDTSVAPPCIGVDFPAVFLVGCALVGFKIPR
ncbi:hypothetical protein FNV43_RR13600 [Rhamnella rubrinervis]|uniref:FAS1 domain-containing protein n=1 Tax=Rhamnella rubrinervis TaxID=2594499 RepID=A0A8K0H1K8_9ROSA|nr:hypothetical protein FNV43_RR13600 [Rhamnella rubrinervis]